MNKYTYFYSYLKIPSYVVFCLLFAEASINLTYYKDCVFAFVTFMIYFGMLWVNFHYKTSQANKVPDEEESDQQVQELF